MPIPNHRHFVALLLALTALASSCASPWRASKTNSMHGGIHYKIDPDRRNHRVEKSKDGRLMYDSPELTVICEKGRININGVDCGAVAQGDRVEITDLQTVLVNGERRGDCMTGHQANAQRLRQRKQSIQSVSAAAAAPSP
ncbi:hypothetical protein [Planctomicrobium sp. SH664]|uniref:hypothetical protein n=1 Tax=Planctomicrobium sp. SH664 TaxID=3448125 RepID=UPI003F5B300C